MYGINYQLTVYMLVVLIGETFRRNINEIWYVNQRGKNKDDKKRGRPHQPNN